jgi:hypothetical protein
VLIHDKHPATIKVRNIFEASNSAVRNDSMLEAVLLLEPLILIALREESIALVAFILFSVASSQIPC